MPPRIGDRDALAVRQLHDRGDGGGRIGPDHHLGAVGVVLLGDLVVAIGVEQVRVAAEHVAFAADGLEFRDDARRDRAVRRRSCRWRRGRPRRDALARRRGRAGAVGFLRVCRRGGYGLAEARRTDACREPGHDLEEVPHDAQFGDAEYLRVRVAVDGDDVLRRLHAGQVLDRAGQAHGQVQARGHGLAREANLVRVAQPAAVHHVARGAQSGAAGVRQLPHQAEVLRPADAAPHGDHGVRILQAVGLRRGDESVAAYPAAQGARGWLPHDDVAFAPRLRRGRPCGPWPDGGHLRPVVGRLDGGEDVAADGGPRLEQEARARLNVQFGAVGGETGAELDGDIGHECPARRGGAGNEDFRGLLTHESDEAGGVRFDEEVLQFRGLDREDPVAAARHQVVEVRGNQGVADDDRREVRRQFVGQQAAARDQFVPDPLDATGVLLRQDPHTLVFCCTHRQRRFASLSSATTASQAASIDAVSAARNRRHSRAILG